MTGRGKAFGWIGAAPAAVLLMGPLVVTTPASAAVSTRGDVVAARASEDAVTRGRIRIVRDTFGVPHVYASTVRDLFAGYGYVVGQDRLFQMEMAKRATQGKVAEVLGEAYVDFDISIRRNFTPASIRRQLDALPSADRAILEGYAAGLNAWIAKVTGPQRATHLPKEFSTHGFDPSRWSAYDVAMVFVGTMANRYSDSNAELDNHALLGALRAKHGDATGRTLFDQLKWLVDTRAATTITAPVRPGGRGRAASATGRAAAVSSGSLRPLSPAAGAAVAASAASVNSPAVVAPSATGFSNAWVVGRARSAGARSMLLNGPQFSWFAPAYTYSIGLHGAGFDLVGNTPFAYPVVLFGHNASIGWGATAGVGDTVDLFQERLHPDDEHVYRHKGTWRRMERRVETIAVKGGTPRQVQVWRTVHGLVTRFDPGARTAYAKARSWEGRELDSLFGWIHSTRAGDYAAWRAQASRMAITINWYYNDRRGNIGYIHTGAYPRRAPGQDPRLPTPGDGSRDWRGIKPFGTNPQVYNPDSGYIVNWNNAPAPKYTNPDFTTFHVTDRVKIQHEQFARQAGRHGRISPETLWGFVRDSATTDVNADLVPYAVRAAAGAAAGSAPRLLAEVLRTWDRHERDADRDGRYDHPANAVMRTWLPILLERVIADDLPAEHRARFTGTRYFAGGTTPDPASINTSDGTRVVFNALLGEDAGVPQRYDVFNGRPADEVLRETLAEAATKLASTYGPDIATWRAPAPPQTFSTSNFLGVPQALPEAKRTTQPYTNRGTENNLIVFDRAGGVAGWEVVAPGQSGFVAPDGSTTRHYDDQVALFADFGKRRTWFTPADVRRHRESVEEFRR